MNLRKLVFAAPLLALAVFGCVVGVLGGDPIKEAINAVDDAGVPCGDDPFKCKPGTTCWPTVDGGATCVASKAYKTKGTDCELLVGKSSCADGLVCITVEKPLDAGADTGKEASPMPTSEPLSLCAPWCDDKHPCPAGESCRTVFLEGYQGRACIPSDLEPRDSGTPDTAMPDTSKPDTFKADTFKPDDGVDTTVMDTAMDTAMPETAPDTSKPDTAPEVSDSADAD